MSIMQIMDSKPKIRVLERLIARNATFSVSGISRLCSIPKATVSGLINEWEEEGLVSCEYIGRNKMVSMNSKFYLLPEIRRMFTKEIKYSKILIEKTRTVKSFRAKNVKAVIVFGSRARNNAKGKSDLDILIVMDSSKNNVMENAIGELVKISEETGVKYAPVFISAKDTATRVKEGDEFIKNILREGKVIKGEKWLEHIQTALEFSKRKI